ncbi:MAG: formate/nitrite transporter family protein [Bacteroidales bacterium]
MSVNNPVEVIKRVLTIGENKVALNSNDIPRSILLSILAGIYIAMGSALALMVGNGFTEVVAGNPIVKSLLGGMVFPIGLILVVMLGAELFTGNNALLIPSLGEKRYSFGKVLKNWGIVYVGNFIGAIFFAYVFIYLAEISAKEPYHQAAMDIAVAKTSLPWMVAFIRGVAANWFVCLAVWLALSCNSAGAKMFGCWLPVFTFVTFGFEHSIANMFFIPLGIFEGAAVTWGDFAIKNLIPVTLGNIVGGAIFVGLTYYYINKKGISRD